jgi:hypothetical protein
MQSGPQTFSPQLPLSPNKLVRTQAKHCIRSNNMDVEFSLNILCKLNNAGAPSVTDSDSQHYCLHVRMTERIISNDMEKDCTKPK